MSDASKYIISCLSIFTFNPEAMILAIEVAVRGNEVLVVTLKLKRNRGYP